MSEDRKQMTVEDLIAELQKLPKDALVFVEDDSLSINEVYEIEYDSEENLVIVGRV